MNKISTVDDVKLLLKVIWCILQGKFSKQTDGSYLVNVETANEDCKMTLTKDGNVVTIDVL